LFYNVSFDALENPVTFEQAAQITVNAMQTPFVQNLREIYINQGIDVYEEASNPLLAAKGAEGLKGKIKYGYTVATLGDKDTNTYARDAFGYPGTALIASDADGKPLGAVKGFVPHYALVASFTTGIDTTAANLGAKLQALYAPGGIPVSLLNGQDYIAVNIAGYTAYPNGTHFDVISYAGATATLYAAVGILETLIENPAVPYAAVKKYPYDASVGGVTFDVAVGANALTVLATADPTAAAPIAGTTKVLAAKTVTASAITVTGSNTISGLISYTDADHTTATSAIGAGAFGGNVSTTGLNWQAGKVQAIIGDFGAIHKINGEKIATWSATAATTTYLYLPPNATPSALLGDQSVDANKVDYTKGIYAAILEDGTVKRITVNKAGTALNGNGKENKLSLVTPMYGTDGAFYEYTINADGTYNLFDVAIFDFVNWTADYSGGFVNATAIVDADHTPILPEATWTAIATAAPLNSIAVSAKITVVAVDSTAVYVAAQQNSYAAKVFTGYQNVYARDGQNVAALALGTWTGSLTATRVFLVYTDAASPGIQLGTDSAGIVYDGYGALTAANRTGLESWEYIFTADATNPYDPTTAKTFTIATTEDKGWTAGVYAIKGNTAVLLDAAKLESDFTAISSGAAITGDNVSTFVVSQGTYVSGTMYTLYVGKGGPAKPTTDGPKLVIAYSY
ncbi:MAG: hypothetical protein LBN97_07990, partial [Oscillospiraceae bacterium]|nr:hypothetical protein [Oscillospiraceae bacterium]